MSQTPPWLYGWEDLSSEVTKHRLEEKDELEDVEEEELLIMLREAQGESSEDNSRLQTPRPDSREVGRDLSDLIWDWSSSPNIEPPKHWRLHTKSLSRSTSEGRRESEDDSGREETGGYLTLLLSNIISLVIGTSIGVWLYKRNILKYSNVFV